MKSSGLALLIAAVVCGCASAPLESDDGSMAPRNIAGGGGGAGSSLVPALGSGRPSSVELVVVFEPRIRVQLSATGLAFSRATPGELWVTLRQFPSGKPCTSKVNAGCAALQGVVAVVSDATGLAPQSVIKEDGNSWHFMRRPSGIAWGEGETFGTCGEAFTDNFEDDPTPYAGPVLWSSDPAIFGVKPKAGQNGTHLDMLHESPFCMGIAHEVGNAYWVVNGDAGSLDRYDFHTPHEIGGANHDDGEVYRYLSGQLAREPEVPSHLAYDSERKVLYVADTGHGRILRVDPSTATDAGAIETYEVLQGSGARDGATVLELVPPGLLAKPSGVWLGDDVLYVTDNATSHIHAFNLAGKRLQTLDTGLPKGSLGGITLGPDAKLYVADLLSGKVRRIEPQ